MRILAPFDVVDGARSSRHRCAIGAQKDANGKRRLHQHLRHVCERTLECSSDPVVGAIYVPQPVGFVDDDEVPRDDHQFVSMARRELIRADDKGFLFEGTAHAVFLHLIVVTSFKNYGRQKEFFLDLLRPLFAQISRRDDKHAPPPFRPLLRNDKSGFDGFSEADFVGKDRAL